jgi:hypothetical protein
VVLKTIWIGINPWKGRSIMKKSGQIAIFPGLALQLSGFAKRNLAEKI